MKYPFEFTECLLTDSVLDALGFTEYWSGSGEYGDRKLKLGSTYYMIFEMDPLEDEDQGYSSKHVRCPGHFVSDGFETRLYFLHDMIEDVKARRTPNEYDVFLSLCKQRGVNLGSYLDSYFEWKEQAVTA